MAIPIVALDRRVDVFRMRGRDSLLALFHTLDALIVVEPNRLVWRPTSDTVSLANSISDKTAQLCRLTGRQAYPLIVLGNGSQGWLFAELMACATLRFPALLEQARANALQQVRALLAREAARRPGLRVGVLGGAREYEVALVANAAARANCQAIVIAPLCVSAASFGAGLMMAPPDEIQRLLALRRRASARDFDVPDLN